MHQKTIRVQLREGPHFVLFITKSGGESVIMYASSNTDSFLWCFTLLLICIDNHLVGAKIIIYSCS